MRKLTLDSLQVESFATSSTLTSGRGTVEAHAEAPQPGVCRNSSIAPVPTYDVNACDHTEFFDCTFGCSQISNCNYVCDAPAEPVTIAG